MPRAAFRHPIALIVPTISRRGSGHVLHFLRREHSVRHVVRGPLIELVVGRVRRLFRQAAVRVNGNKDRCLITCPFTVRMRFVGTRSTCVNFHLFSQLICPRYFARVEDQDDRHQIKVDIFPITSPPNYPVEQFRRSRHPSPYFAPEQDLSHFVPGRHFPMGHLPKVGQFPFVSCLTKAKEYCFPKVPGVHFSFD